MKKCITVILAALLLCGLLTLYAFSAMLGDTDGNGKITSADARIALRISAKLEKPDDEMKKRADVDRNGRVNSSDARIILRAAAKLSDLTAADEYVTFSAEDERVTLPDTQELLTLAVDDEILAPPDTGESVSLPPEQVRLPDDRTSYYAAGSRGLLTPFTDNGLGKARFCEVLSDKGETSDAADKTDKSSVLCTPLTKGTFDTVVGEQTYNGKKMYVLSCGLKAYAKDVRIVQDGYVLPPNRLTAGETVVGKNTTDLYLDTLWAVPANIGVLPQEYHTGYQDRKFNVSAFTAQYLDVTFYHTSAVTGNFSLPSNGLFKSFTWLSKGNGSVTLRCLLSEVGNFSGCSVSLTDDGRFCISVKNMPAQTKTVVIDPGHGGKDTGAKGFSSATPEAALNLAIATQTVQELRSRGIRVITVRTSDEEHSLDERRQFSRYFKPDAYVSIHNDYTDSASATGTHAFYYYPWSMPLAECVHRHMVEAYREKIYTPGTAAYARADRGIHFYPFFVTRVEECPAILVECGFVSNRSEYNVLCTAEHQRTLAKAIADGIIEFLESK
ncbi:MAG: N-acetylmuramoyl-L-alanine amidase [Clostridia bacterium]|nr:N-acetylmuramoyl-L-alanine amidase [Clostridia bacterium]